MATCPVVLVVEDNTELRHVLEDALKSEGYEVLGARDESDARALLREHRVDLLISDLTPSPGDDALEKVREEFPDIPVVALAGQGGHPPLFSAAWQAPGRFRTLARPFRLRELLAVSREVLEAS
jgi:DNA-binding NtrC family response regulator